MAFVQRKADLYGGGSQNSTDGGTKPSGTTGTSNAGTVPNGEGTKPNNETTGSSFYSLLGTAVSASINAAIQNNSKNEDRRPNLLDSYFEEHQKYLDGLQTNAQKAYNEMLKYYQNAPAAYKPSEWQGKADDVMEQYLNRGPFQYDVNADAIYQQYKDNYIQQGQMAMMDTMGQAAAMTGGYGSSYAQTVGQQVYNQQLSQLNNVIPELYGMAQDRYDREGQAMLDRYNIYADKEAQEFEKYQGEVANWLSGGQQLSDNYTALQQQYNI